MKHFIKGIVIALMALPMQAQNAVTRQGALNTKFVAHDTGGDDTYAVATPTSGGACPAALADGLTVELVVDTTNTGAATLDFCGLGALEITAALAGTDLTNGDLVVGKPYLLRYYDTGTDLWIVTLPGASGGSAIAPSLWPFGAMTNTAGVTARAVGTANNTVYYAFTAQSPLTVTYINAYMATAVGHVAVALYDSSCNLLGGSATLSSPGAAPVQFTFSPAISASAGELYFAFTGDSTADAMYATASAWVGDIANSGASGTGLRVFTGNSSTGTSTLTFNASCGTRTSYTSASTGLPAIFIH